VACNSYIGCSILVPCMHLFLVREPAQSELVSPVSDTLTGSLRNTLVACASWPQFSRSKSEPDLVAVICVGSQQPASV
jgi:hypothetical protein